MDIKDLLRVSSRVLPDSIYIKLKYYSRFKKFPDLKNPKTYNEKLQWIKLHDRNPEYISLVDKYEVKKIVAEKIGEEYIIPTLGVWDSFDEIDFDKLPDQFVLKCTHDSGGLVICKDKSKLDIAATREKINKSLKTNYYWEGREWPYKNVKPRIIAEKYMVDESGTELKDYKFFCFGGEPKILLIGTDRVNGLKVDLFDMEFNHLPFKICHPNSEKKLNKPGGFDTMLKLSRELSKGIRHVRIDFYDINGKVYFGEVTFFNAGGMLPFDPEEWDYKLGEYIKL